MDALELYVKLVREAGYQYPYTEIAKELSELRGVKITRQAIWNECNGVQTSAEIREFIASKLKLKTTDIFPITKSLKEVA